MKFTRFSAVAIAILAVVLAGCAGNPDNIRVATKMMVAANELVPGMHYIQGAGGFNFGVLNSIIYKHPEKKADGSDITVLVANASPEFWAEVVKIATGGAFIAGAAAVHGVSFPAAKAAVNNVSGTGGTGTGGAGGTGGTGTGGAGGTGGTSCSGTGCTNN